MFHRIPCGLWAENDFIFQGPSGLYAGTAVKIILVPQHLYPACAPASLIHVIQLPLQSLLHRQEEHKVLIVLSDGRPNDIIVNRPNSLRPGSSGVL